MRSVPLVGVVLLALLASGCVPGAAKPSFTCTPIPPEGSTVHAPYACDEAEYRAEQQDRAARAEALVVYRRLFDELDRVRREGGVDELTPTLLETTGDDYAAELQQALRQTKQQGTVVTGAPPTLAVKDDLRPAHPAATVSLTTCEDLTSLTYTTNGQSQRGYARVCHPHLRTFPDGRLKVFLRPCTYDAVCPLR